jgi:cation diffusion facilitator CzcD-associated flavoprotein CzcO
MRRTSPAPRVGIIGAGFGGIGMAIQLRRHGIESFTVFEKADRLGGTWRDNTYPGAACDVPSHLYSFSFERKLDWSRKFPPQDEILQYLEDTAKKHDLFPHIRFGCEIARAEYDETANVWRVTTGSGEEHELDVLVAATGQLNRPHVPDFAGLGEFAGTMWHSAKWDHEHDLAGDDVAVIGTGASAIQFVPQIAPRSRSVTIFQRSPAWVGPKPDAPFSERAKRVFERVPFVDWLYRASIYWRFESRYLLMRRNTRYGRLVTERGRAGLGALVSDRLPREAVVPDYPIGCKRILIANDWYPTLLRDDVTVVTTPIERFDRDGIVTADGEHRRFDTVIFGTGFESTSFLAPIDVRGRGGASLHERWAGGAEAHLGLTVAGFPNLFLLYGPNTNLGHNSIIFMLEQQFHYVLDAIERMRRRGAAAIDVSTGAMRRSNDRLQRSAGKTVWLAGCRNWYTNAAGKLTNNWPLPTVTYWWRTRRVRLSDYEVLGRRR